MSKEEETVEDGKEENAYLPTPKKSPIKLIGFTARGLAVYQGGVVSGDDYGGGYFSISSTGKKYAVRDDRIKKLLENPKIVRT
jgi:hypothetical protein